MPRPIEIPYRLPTSFSDKEHKVGAKVITLCDWRECTTMNPTLQEEAAEEMYPWQTWDEIKYRKTVVELGHALASGSWGLHSQTARDRELLLSSITETRKNIELAVARAALRMIEERYYNGTLEMCKYFAYPGALEFVTSRFHQKGLQWYFEALTCAHTPLQLHLNDRGAGNMNMKLRRSRHRWMHVNVRVD